MFKKYIQFGKNIHPSFKICVMKVLETHKNNMHMTRNVREPMCLKSGFGKKHTYAPQFFFSSFTLLWHF